MLVLLKVPKLIRDTEERAGRAMLVGMAKMPVGPQVRVTNLKIILGLWLCRTPEFSWTMKSKN